MQMNRSALCLAGLASLATALILENLTGTFPGASVEEYWETQAGDPSQFTLLLANIDGGVPLALAASVNTSVGHVFFQTPDVPVGYNYVLEAVNVTNNAQVYAQTDTFIVS